MVCSMTSRINGEATFRAAVDKAVSRMVGCEHRLSYSLIRMPVWLPSGSCVVIEVWPSQGGTVVVTDGGTTYHEAEVLSADSQFKRYASKYAESVGVKYEHESFSIEGVSYDQISGAIGFVSSCAKHVLDHAVINRDKKRYQDDTDILYDRLTRVFSPKRVARDVEIKGISTHLWKFATAVSGRSRQIIFEPVANHTGSIASASMKFHDVALLDNPPGRTSVVSNKQEYGDMIAVLAQASDVIEQSAKDETIRRLVGNSRAA